MPPQKRKADLTEDEIQAEQRKHEVLARIQSLDADDTKSYLYELCDRWQLQFPNRTFDQVLHTAFNNFEVPLDGDLALGDHPHYGFNTLDSTIHTHEMEAIAMYHHLRHHGLIGDGATNEAGDDDTDDGADDLAAQSAELLNKSLKLLEMVYYAKRIVLSTYQAKLAIHQVHCADIALHPDTDARLGSWALRFRWIESSMTEMQEVIMFILDCAFEKQLRKQNGCVFEPIMVDDKFNSHAYRYVSEVKEWVFSVCRKELQWKQWTNLLHGTGTIKAVVEYLTGCKDYQFPDLEKRRDVFAFRNGVYVAGDNKFYEYEAPGETLADTVIACKFFNCQFEPYEEILDWRLIPTPHLQGILDYQGLPADVCDWMYIFLGRMLYDVGDYDGWQVMPFVKGYAGTGKSTICTHVIRNFYDPIDVGVLSNNHEKQFGLSAFYDKYLLIGPEVRNDLKIEQAEFQSIVSGEDIQVAMKHKKAFSVRWRVPGWMAGNEVPTWADAAGSIQRRLPVFDFPRPVTRGDMRLGEKLEQELPDIMVKANRAYRSMAAAHGGDNIWTLLGPYFANTSSELAQTINVLEAFLASDEVVVTDDAFCPFEEFKNAVTAYATINNATRPRFNVDYFRGPFSRHGIRKEKCSKTWRSRTFTNKDFVLGVDLAHQDILGGGVDNALG